MSSTHFGQHVNAPRANVYRALLDARAVMKWKVPDGMTSQVHEFDAREGGSIRVSLAYDAPMGTGKTTARTDTYRGRFTKLVPNEQVVEVDEFETADPSLQGEMTITCSLRGATRDPTLRDNKCVHDKIFEWQDTHAKGQLTLRRGQAAHQSACGLTARFLDRDARGATPTTTKSKLRG